MSTEEGTQARWQVRTVVDALSPISRGPQRPLAHLALLRHAQDGLNRATFLMVDAARREGATWAEIGTALGISRQAAHQAATRRRILEEARADAKTWRLPLPFKRPRLRWLPRRSA